MLTSYFPNFAFLLDGTRFLNVAIYLGGNKFSARAYASNFDNETMMKAVDYAHSYNVKVYVTINTYQFYIETVIAIKDAYEKLNDKEKQVISMIFYAKEKEANQRSVAKKLGVSQPFVSRTVKKFRNYLITII